MLCDDKVSNDSDSKENQKSASKKLKQPGAATTSDTTTSFNPFGKFKVMLECNRMVLRKAVDKLIESFQSEPTDQAKLFLKRRPEATQLVIELKKVQTTIRTLAKSNPIAVTSALTVYIPLLAKLADQFSKQLTNVRSGDIMLISQTISEFLSSIGEFCQAPFSSELLEDWCILFESFLKSNVAILKTSAITLWRNTFAKNTGKIKYPNNTLRNLLVSTQAKPPLVVPEADDKEEAVDQFVEEEAMDGIEVLSAKTPKSPAKSKATGFAEPNVPKSQESLSSFELSQQPNFDNLAQKLISEKSSVPSQPNTPESSKKKRAAEKLLIDEDSCDFVVIKTPASGKKNKLTDHQMEKFEESRDGINYINEESQSGTQRQTNLKNALTTFNFEVQHTSESSSSSAAPVASEVDNATRKPTKRQRRSLFNDDVVKDEKTVRKTRSKKMKLQDEAVKTMDECMVDTNPDTGDESSGTLPVMEIPKTLTETPLEKLASKELSPAKSETAIESSSDTSEEKEEEKGQKKRKSRAPKKLVTQLITPRRKSSRHSTVKETEIVESSQEPTPQKATEAEKIVEPVEDKVTNECVEETDQKTPDDSPAKVEDVVLPIVSTPSNRKIPAAASTPSILRKTPVEGTPLTEKKKNRVHFDADSLDIGIRKSASPKRMPPPTPFPVSTTVSRERSSSPQKVEKTSSSLFDMEIESGPIYPDLKNCDEAVDVLVHNLVPFAGVVTAMSILRRSFSSAGIKTIGQLSQMTRTQIMKMNGIRTPRDKTAKKVLTEYAANINKLSKKYTSEPKIEQSPKQIKDIKKTPELVRKIEVASVEPARKVEVAPVEPARTMEIAAATSEVEVKPEDTKQQSLEPVVAKPIDAPVAEVAKKPEETENAPKPVVKKSENVPDAQLDTLKEAEELDRLVRSISRKMGREKFAADISSQIDDRIYDAFLVLRGLVKERGFSNV